MFLFQENPERNNGIEKKDEFVRSIVWWSISMFVSLSILKTIYLVSTFEL